MRSKIGAGVVAGLLAGLVFGILMHVLTMPMAEGGSMPMAEAGSMPMAEAGGMPMDGEGRMPMMAMFAQVVRSESLIAGWIYLLFSSVVMGGLFGTVLADRAARIGGGLAWGVLYGVLLWFLGGLILMPVLLGMAAFAPLTMAPMRPGTLWSLGAHLLSGLILGGVFAGLYRGEPPASHPVTGG